MEQNLLTIVTPTYNRAYILENTYESLKKQTDKSFNWLIIDDGSNDETEFLVEQWKKEKVIDINYFKKVNGGKASALNYSFEIINTKYYVCLDSDDTFTEKAVEMALNNLRKIENDKTYCGVIALRTNSDGKVLGGKQIPKGIKSITVSEITDDFNIKSELITFYKAEIVKKYSFPIIENEKFITPGYLDRIVGKDYKFLVSRESYCVCEYLSDGLTNNKVEVIKKNPNGYTLVLQTSFALATNFKAKCKYCIMYIAGSFLSEKKNFIKDSPNKPLTILLYPIGFLAYKLRFS